MSRGNNFVMSNFFRLLAEKKQKMEGGQEIIADVDGQYTYRLGIIDFLTKYTVAKKFETKMNSVIHWGEGDKTSCQHPDDYQKRFVAFMEESF